MTAKQSLLALPLLTIALRGSPAFSLQHEAHQPSATSDLAKEEADKRFSEFNHRFAGIFVFLVGVVALLQPILARRFGVIRYLWVFLF